MLLQVAATREAAFAYMSDWSTIAQWDPNTRGSTKARARRRDVATRRVRRQRLARRALLPQTTPGAVGVGTKYDITTVFKGNESAP